MTTNIKRKGTVRPETVRGFDLHADIKQSVLVHEAVALDTVYSHDFVIARASGDKVACSALPEATDLATTVAALIAFALARGFVVTVAGDSDPIDYAATLQKFVDTFYHRLYVVKEGDDWSEAPGIDNSALDPALRPRNHIVKLADVWIKNIMMDVNHVAKNVVPTTEGPLLLVIDNTTGAVYVAPHGISQTGKTVAAIPGTMITGYRVAAIRSDAVETLLVDVNF